MGATIRLKHSDFIFTCLTMSTKTNSFHSSGKTSGETLIAKWHWRCSRKRETGGGLPRFGSEKGDRAKLRTGLLTSSHVPICCLRAVSIRPYSMVWSLEDSRCQNIWGYHHCIKVNDVGVHSLIPRFTSFHVYENSYRHLIKVMNQLILMKFYELKLFLHYHC